MAQPLPAVSRAEPPAHRGASPADLSAPGTSRPEAERAVCAGLFWAWLTLRTAAWTLLAGLTLPNAPLDLIEWLAWGHEWRWGYPKHPPFPAWVAEVFSRLSPGGVGGVYLAGYLATACCLWAVWRLAREVLPPRPALAAALAAEGIIFFAWEPAEFSNNVVLNACWALAILCLHRALATDRARWWAGLGLAAGLGLLSKYTLAFLLGPMVAYLLCDPHARRSLARPGPYLAAAVATALFAPHFLWMVRNDFRTVSYALERSADAPSWVNHFKNPVLFALSQGARLLPVFLILVPLTSLRWRPRELSPRARSDRRFLLAVVLGPVALLLLLSLLRGVQLREIWGSPLWSFTGVLVLLCLRGDTTGRALARSGLLAGAVAAVFFGIALTKFYLEARFVRVPNRVQFPGARLAGEVTRAWGRWCDRPFGVVGGECWMAGNVACYARHRPSLYSSGAVGMVLMEERVTPWTGDEDLARRGGVLVWDAARMGDDLPAELRGRFPTARLQPPLVLPYQTLAPLPPARVGLAFVLPAGEPVRGSGPD